MQRLHLTSQGPPLAQVHIHKAISQLAHGALQPLASFYLPGARGAGEGGKGQGAPPTAWKAATRATRARSAVRTYAVQAFMAELAGTRAARCLHACQRSEQFALSARVCSGWAAVACGAVVAQWTPGGHAHFAPGQAAVEIVYSSGALGMRSDAGRAPWRARASCAAVIARRQSCCALVVPSLCLLERRNEGRKQAVLFVYALLRFESLSV